MKTTTVNEFYKAVSALVPEGIGKEIGHFHVFSIADMMERNKEKFVMPYNRRAFYKISLIKGRTHIQIPQTTHLPYPIPTNHPSLTI